MNRELTSQEIVFEFDIENMSLEEREYYLPEYDEVNKKIKEALEIDREGYHVYLIDDFSKEKLKYITNFVEGILSSREAPKDICYVVEEDEKTPSVIFVENGKGKVLKEIVEEIQQAYTKCTFDFYNGSTDSEKEKLIDEIHKKRNELIANLMQVAQKDGFDIKPTHNGFTFIPLKEGELMTEKEYDVLDIQKKDEILDKVNKLKSNAQGILQELKDNEVDQIEKIKSHFEEYYSVQMEDIKSKYKELFKENERVLNYLDKICKNIEENIIENYGLNYDDDEEKINEIIYKYSVNVIADHSGDAKPRVIFEEDPSVNNLLGSIEYENRNGTYMTDVSLIKAGSMLLANEGCIILRMSSLLSNASAYYYLKRALLSERVNFDCNRGYLELLSMSGLKPEPVSIKEKVILIGDFETYDILYNYDEDFKKIFKIRAEYNPVVKLNDDTKKALVKNIFAICKENKLKPLNNEAIREVAKYLSRKAENRNKLYFDEHEINKLLTLSNNRVVNAGRRSIEAKDIIDVGYAEDLVEKELLENYKSKKLLINVKDHLVGQINGLSVIDTGYFNFGKPIRITCSCYKGDGNIVDVQKESNLSGSIHSKSINILKGYINRITGGYTKLPVDFHVSFEQLYGKIDGDSASVAEVLCMISALSRMPIKQSIAVTGSINQFGEVQPIGGVNEKIEGFYKVCKLMDTTENKGVLIPFANKDDLLLSEEVENEIKKGRFHLYTMTNIEDAIEVLMEAERSKVKNVLAAIDRETKKYNNVRKDR